jgi:hypothetical protein
MIGWLFSPIGRALAAIGAILVAIFTIYEKGRKDAKNDIKLKETQESQKKLKKALDADDAARRNNSNGGLLDNDGYRRD